MNYLLRERFRNAETFPIITATLLSLAAFLLISFHFFTKNTYLYGQKKAMGND